ncbi:MAG TPA: S41 family peptidase [bacterium]
MTTRISKILIALPIIIFIALIITGGTVCKNKAQAGNPYESIGLFTETMKKIQDLYWRDVDTKELIYGAIKGMVSSLDRYSSFMTPDQYKDMQADTKGSFGGIGIEITVKDGVLTVVSPIEDTPAFNAGILAEDKILEINGESTQHMNVYDAVKKIRGPKGSTVILTIIREGFKSPKKFTLSRETIIVKSVKYKLLEPGYGYARITQFQERTDTDLKKVLDEMMGAGALKGLILDLRSNPGGLLDQALKVSDLFLSSGLIVYTDGRLENQKQRFEAKKGDDFSDGNMIVLVDGGSASASEIVAGALRDNQRAVLLGTKTFGKGTVQTIYPMQDGSAIRLTTAHYYTPGGESIEEKGIIPDIVVQLEKTTQAEVNGEQKSSYKEVDLKNDIQLQRALDYLKSWNIFSTKSKNGNKVEARN